MQLSDDECAECDREYESRLQRRTNWANARNDLRRCASCGTMARRHKMQETADPRAPNERYRPVYVCSAVCMREIHRGPRDRSDRVAPADQE